MPHGLVVGKVLPGSIADEMGVQPGDQVISIDGQEVKDILDFQYLTAEEEFTILLQKNGEIWELEIERDPEEYLGLEFEAVSREGLKTCRNNCVFCFISQMPGGMRETLYAKDDDYRMSLTQGSFITLSNLGEEEFQRILSLHVSPLYISVHAWDPGVRVKLMKNPQAALIGPQLTRLAEAGITVHAQIVLVPGYNDGEVLHDTVRHLAGLYPSVQSIAVVPVGLTRFREGLPPLRPFSGEEAGAILTNGEKWQAEFMAKYGKHLVYFADEFYALADRPFPPVSIFDDFAQLENGVGMASKFAGELSSVWEELPQQIPGRRIHVVTGKSAEKFFQDWGLRLQEKVRGLQVVVQGVVNEFFGPQVTVAGLLTAGDIACQLGDLGGEEFLIPRVMLKAGEDVFLDDRDVSWVEERVHGRCRIVENDGIAFLENVLNMRLGGGKIE